MTGVAQLVGCRSAKQKVPVQFPVRAHVWVVGLVPGWGAHERQPVNASHISVSLPLFLRPFPYL